MSRASSKIGSQQFLPRAGRLTLLCATGSLLASCAWQSNANEGLPRDVARFIERRDSCEHFMGEEPYDVQRAAYLARQAEKYCRGSDAELSRLKAKFSSNGRVIAELEKYDSDIEP